MYSFGLEKITLSKLPKNFVLSTLIFLFLKNISNNSSSVLFLYFVEVQLENSL
ncbi:hypothetical protein LEQ41_03735 [Streptococcus agalactiae]|nr:hypothetical protein [Streptococcus agalactiae]